MLELFSGQAIGVYRASVAIKRRSLSRVPHDKPIALVLHGCCGQHDDGQRPPSSSSCVQQASKRKTGLRASPARPAKELTQILRSAGEHLPRRWVLGEPKPADGPFSGGRITGESREFASFYRTVASFWESEIRANEPDVLSVRMILIGAALRT